MSFLVLETVFIPRPEAIKHESWLQKVNAGTEMAC